MSRPFSEAGVSRPFLVAGNWKMHHLREDARRYCRILVESARPRGLEVVLFPSFPLLPIVAESLDGSGVGVGAQDLHPDDEGAHTGDVSPRQVRDAGGDWVLCGHSERRADHHEGDELVAAKVRAATRAGLRPILCLGETLAERDGGATEEVLERQLGAVLDTLADDLPVDLVLAYEPVWAIGTGKTATPELAQEAHAFLRQRLRGGLGAEAAAGAPLLYGGSVKPNNCVELARQQDVDGFLVGGASLDPGSFLDIIERCAVGDRKRARER